MIFQKQKLSIVGFFLILCLLLIFSSSAYSNGFNLKAQPSFVVEAGLYPELGKLSSESGFTPDSDKLEPDFSESKRKAIFMSLLIPGWGEKYAGRMTRAKAFFITELFLWSTYAGFKIYENWIEDEFIVFAERHAQAQPEGKKHKYYVNLGNYDDIYQYNAAKLNYRSLDEVYPETKEYYWKWDSQANKHNFKMMRIRADNANYRALFSLGLIMVNHVVSAVDAVWVTRTHRKDKVSQNPLKIQFTNPKFDEYRIVLSKHF